VSVLKYVVRFGECFGERFGFHGDSGELGSDGGRLDGQPRLFGEVNQVEKERRAFLAGGPKWQADLEQLYMCKWRAKKSENGETTIAPRRCPNPNDQ